MNAARTARDRDREQELEDEAKSLELALQLSLAEQKGAQDLADSAQPYKSSASIPLIATIAQMPRGSGGSRSPSLIRANEPFAVARTVSGVGGVGVGVGVGGANAVGDVLPPMGVSHIHEELLRLAKDERALLLSEDITAAEKTQVRDQFFHQKMGLLMRLPPEDQAQYHPKIARKYVMCCTFCLSSVLRWCRLSRPFALLDRGMFSG